ncbi:MAG: hypothetical protein LBI73_01990 [Myroides sp.]|jgi:hypothetical protein|nr:hypothetical protein [Myroides sp.]
MIIKVIKKVMKNRIIFLLALFCVSITFAQKAPARAFPYSLSLQGTEKPQQIIEQIKEWNTDNPGSKPPTNPVDRYTEEGLVLTRLGGDNTAFALNEISFTSNYGMVVEFEYAMYGGKTYAGRYGDGLSFFIYDDKKNFDIGSHGGGLGYTYRDASIAYSGVKEAGLNGAYLGIGFDAYGEFSRRGWQNSEKREGLPDQSLIVGKGSKTITIRGGMHNGSRTKGYPVLYSAKRALGVRYTQNDILYAKLNYSNGLYETGYDNGYNDFDVRASDTRADFTKVILTVLPNGNQGTFLTVEAEYPGGTSTIVRDLEYKNEFKTFDQSGKLYSFKTKIPETFKIGFAGSNGGAYQIQVIKNVKVSLPYGPETYDMDFTYCNNGSDGILVFDPLSSSRFYSGTVTNPDWGNSDKYVDKHSFRFEDEYGYPTDTAYKYVEPGVGTWEYDQDKREVTFTPERNTIPVGEYSVYFSAKGTGNGGGPFGTEYYRSRPTRVKLIVEECNKKVKINPNLPIKVRMR